MGKIISFTGVKPKTIGLLLNEFKQEYFSYRSENPKTLTTWKTVYEVILTKLDSSSFLTEGILKELILKTKPDTRNRQKYCIAAKAFANFAGLSINTKRLKGCYSHKSVNRVIPSDESIAAFYSEIPNSEWQWVYGVLAAYGLRPHEVFNVDYDRLINDGLVYVKDGKTGARLVLPFYPEWVKSFKLQQVIIPKVTGSCNAELGSRVSRAFNRYKIPFPAYSLRHAWAIRTIKFGIDRSLAAKQMGHSVSIHTDIYHRWITEQQQMDVYQGILEDSNRPKPKPMEF